jgi:hypothetical protein
MELQQAQRLEAFIQKMQAIENPTPGEAAALERAIAAMPGDIVQDYGARYRGLAQGLTLGGGDELRAAGAAIVPNGQNYDQALEEQRARNLAAEMLNPQEYATGKTAGQIGAAAATMAVPALAASTPFRAVGAGALTGGALAAAPSFLEGEGGFQRRISRVPPSDVAIGSVLGAAAPVIGQIAGGATRAVQNIGRGIEGYGSRASQVAAKGVGRTVETGEDIQAYLRNLGPEATLADVPGGPQAQAMGLAAQQGSGGTVVSQALRSRAAGSEGRIEDVVTDVAGDPSAAFRQRLALEAERTGTLGPAYEAATSYQGRLDVNDALAAIDSMLESAVGGTAARLNAYKRMLSADDGQISAAKLHNIRTQLNDTMSAATRQGRGGVVASLKPLLQKIDDELDQVPNYTATRTGYGNVKEMERQIDFGRAALAPGRSTTSPDELLQSFSTLSAAQKDAYRTGAREYVAALMGTARNAPATAWGELMTGFNDKKLRILFGDAEADRIMQTLRAEKTFSETSGRVNSGSMTTQRRLAEEELGPVRAPDTGRMPGPISRVKNTLNEATNSAIDSVLYGTRRSQANLDLGKLLSLKGAERDTALQALLAEAQRQSQSTRSQAIIKLLAQMGVGGAIPAVVSEE